MDAWSDRQISFMKAGGNTHAKQWLERYNVKETDMKNKYSSPAMEAYREKLKAAVENRPYTDPSVEELTKKASPYGSRTASPSLNNYSPYSSQGSTQQTSLSSSTSGSSRGNMTTSGDMSRSGELRQTSSGSNGMRSSGSAGYQDSYGGFDEGQGSQDMRTRFSGRTAIGSHDFEPSYGNRPSSGSPHPSNNGDDDLMNTLYDGWSRFSTGVKQVASSAAEKVSSGTLSEDVSQLASKVTDSQTWSYVTSFFSDAAASLSSPQQPGQYRPPPTRDEKSYSSDRPPPPRDDRNGFGGRDGGRYEREESIRYDSGRYDSGRYEGGGGRYDDSRQGERRFGESGQSPQQPRREWGETMDSTRPTGERQGLRYDSRDSQASKRPTQMAPQRAGWGGTSDSWDDWDRSDTNPHVAVADDDVHVEDYKLTTNNGRSPSVQAPQPTRISAAAQIPSSPAADDIYDFQVTPTNRSPAVHASSPAPNGKNAAGAWDDWDDFGSK